MLEIPNPNKIKKQDNIGNSVLRKIRPYLRFVFFLLEIEINSKCCESFLKTFPYSKIITIQKMNISVKNENGLYDKHPKISSAYKSPGISLLRKLFITNLQVKSSINFLH